MSAPPVPTTEDETRFDRSAWFTLSLVALLLFWPLATSLLGFIFPSDGWLSSDGPQGRYEFSQQVVERPTPLRTGDVLVAIEGQPLTLERLPPLPPGLQVGQTVRYTILRAGLALDVDVPLVQRTPLTLLRFLWSSAQQHPAMVGVTLSYFAVAAFVFARRPRDPAARVFLLSSSVWVSFLFVLADWHFYNWAYPAPLAFVHRYHQGIWTMLLFPALIHLGFLFPRRKAPLRRFPRLVPALFYGVPALLEAITVLLVLTTHETVWERVIRLPTLFIVAGLFLLVVPGSLLHSYWAERDPVRRAQLRWFGFGLWAGIGGVLAGFLFNVYAVYADADPSVMATAATVATAGWWSLGLLPLCLGVAILRYRLFDIDLVINRTLVYVTLTACIVGLYMLAVGSLGALFHAQGDSWIHLAGAGFVAVLFQPLRAWLQRGVNRLLYGERDDPYAVIARMGRQLEATLTPAALPAVIVATVREALRLPYVAITLPGGPAHSTPAAAGALAAPAEEELLRVPLSFGQEEVGTLLLAPRARGEPFSSADRRLLADLARPAGVAVRAALLAADLQQARERLVTAREEERRRLRRDLHDGLGPQLASLSFRAEAARNLFRQDADRADGLLRAVTDQAQEAIADIRRLVYALRPPALDEVGLVEALRQQAIGQLGLRVTVETTAPLPPLPAAVEVAAYRIAQEALTNVGKHAQARHCTVRLAPEEAALRVEISDDGVGLPVTLHATGVGLHAMRERAAELGGTCSIELGPAGGTRILAQLPLAGAPLRTEQPISSSEQREQEQEQEQERQRIAHPLGLPEPAISTGQISVG